VVSCCGQTKDFDARIPNFKNTVARQGFVAKALADLMKEMKFGGIKECLSDYIS
jgi:hypothetical protein